MLEQGKVVLPSQQHRKVILPSQQYRYECCCLLAANITARTRMQEAKLKEDTIFLCASIPT